MVVVESERLLEEAEVVAVLGEDRLKRALLAFSVKESPGAGSMAVLFMRFCMATVVKCSINSNVSSRWNRFENTC